MTVGVGVVHFPQSCCAIAEAMEDDVIGIVPYIHAVAGEGDAITGVSQDANREKGAPSETWHNPGSACGGSYIAR